MSSGAKELIAEVNGKAESTEANRVFESFIIYNIWLFI